MQICYGYDYKNEILLATLEGDFQDADLRELLEELRRLSAELRPLAAIIDFSEATVSLSTEKIWSAAQSPAPFTGETRRFLVTPNDHVFGMARMYQMMAGQSREMLSVVRSSDEALAELYVLDALFEPLDATRANDQQSLLVD